MWKAGCISLLPGLLGLVEMSDSVKNGNHLEPVNIIIKWKYNYYCLNPSVCMHPLYFQSPVLFTDLLLWSYSWKKMQPYKYSKLPRVLTWQSVYFCSFGAVNCQEGEQTKAPYCMKYSQSSFVCGSFFYDTQVYADRLQFWQLPFMLNEGRKIKNTELW